MSMRCCRRTDNTASCVVASSTGNPGLTLLLLLLLLLMVLTVHQIQAPQATCAVCHQGELQ